MAFFRRLRRCLQSVADDECVCAGTGKTKKEEWENWEIQFGCAGTGGKREGLFGSDLFGSDDEGVPARPAILSESDLLGRQCQEEENHSKDEAAEAATSPRGQAQTT